MVKQSFTAITIIIIIFVILSGIVYIAESKRCYNCNSRESDTCASSPLPSETIECMRGYNCVKCDYEILNGAVITSRFCGILFVPFETATKSACNTCDTDFCNNANAVSTSMVALGCLVLFWAIRFVLTNF
ncbi:uncharacterized protein [Anoplolepis gracilipes]|uniref:uncharacterized protein n=1 Tax=Anoplolepis gracilipes TaxID=354296 RepID=UPI003B9E0716